MFRDFAAARLQAPSWYELTFGSSYLFWLVKGGCRDVNRYCGRPVSSPRSAPASEQRISPWVEHMAWL